MASWAERPSRCRSDGRRRASSRNRLLACRAGDCGPRRQPADQCQRRARVGCFTSTRLEAQSKKPIDQGNGRNQGGSSACRVRKSGWPSPRSGFFRSRSAYHRRQVKAEVCDGDRRRSSRACSGAPAYCVGIPHEEKPLGRLDNLETVCEQKEIVHITDHGPGPSVAKILHVHGALPPNSYGSPLINQAGHLIGVYAESAVPAEGSDKSDLHYFVTADPRLFDSAHLDPATGVWVAPNLPTAGAA